MQFIRLGKLDQFRVYFRILDVEDEVIDQGAIYAQNTESNRIYIENCLIPLRMGDPERKSNQRLIKMSFLSLLEEESYIRAMLIDIQHKVVIDRIEYCSNTGRLYEVQRNNYISNDCLEEVKFYNVIPTNETP